MSNIDLIFKQLEKPIEFISLSDACIFLDNFRKPISSSNRVKGEYPYYGANGIQDWVNNYLFDGKFLLVGEDGSVKTENGNPVVNWAEGKIWVNNHAHILSEKDGYSLRFIYHYIQTVDITNQVHGNIPKLTGKDIKNIKIPKLPLEVQCEIVRILDNFAELTAELTAELSLRKSQANFYKNNLLIYSLNCPKVSLGDFCEILTGGEAPINSIKSKEPDNAHKYPIYSNGLGQNALWGYADSYRVDRKSITFSSIGTIGYPTIREPNFTPIIRLKVIYPKDESILNLHYLKHALSVVDFGLQKSSVPNINSEMVKSIKIPLPDISRQCQIAKILDNFDKITDSINEGLPAEIKLRQQQYEYYRDKLLSFKELNSEN